MNNQEIETRVVALLAKKLELEPAKVTAEARLSEDLGVDSFGAVELMFDVEEAFGLKIPDSDIEHVRKVSDIVGYIAKYTNGPRPTEATGCSGV